MQKYSSFWFCKNNLLGEIFWNLNLSYCCIKYCVHICSQLLIKKKKQKGFTQIQKFTFIIRKNESKARDNSICFFRLWEMIYYGWSYSWIETIISDSSLFVMTFDTSVCLQFCFYNIILISMITNRQTKKQRFMVWKSYKVALLLKTYYRISPSISSFLHNLSK